MKTRLNVLYVEATGGVLWRGATETLEEAKALIQELAVSSPGKYLIFDIETGTKHIVEANGRTVEDKTEQTDPDARSSDF